jgi:hypothetical protein
MGAGPIFGPGPQSGETCGWLHMTGHKWLEWPGSHRKSAYAASARRHRGARTTRGHRAHGRHGSMADGGPLVDEAWRGLPVKHQR